MRRPTDSSVITLPFGATSPPYSPSNPHQGVDYRARPEGSNIYAPHAGKITLAGSLGDCGKAVDIDGGKYKSRLCHNSKLLVQVGNSVKEGQKVALSGMTGLAGAVHCHWVLWVNGNRVDGSKYITPPIKRTKIITWTRKRIYELREASYIQSIPSGKRAGNILHKKGEKFDIGEYTEWSNGKKFYRTKKQIANKDMRGFGKTKLRRI